MSNQATLERTLKMILMLSRAGGSAIKTMAEVFGVHPRSIQRSINTLKMAGYVVESQNGRYKINRIETKETSGFDIGDLLYFSREEAWMLKEAIANLPGNNAVREDLERKLYSLYNSESVSDQILGDQDNEQIRIITDAIRKKQQIIVKKYAQSTGNRDIKTLIAEPIEFASDSKRVWAYLPMEKTNILLRLSGFAGVLSTTVPFKCEHLHKVGFIDLFRGYGFTRKNIVLLLNHRAYDHMCDEYPMSKMQMTKKGLYHYELNTEVCNYFQAARFCLGLPGEVEVVSPDELKEYIKNVTKNSSKGRTIRFAAPYKAINEKT